MTEFVCEGCLTVDGPCRIALINDNTPPDSCLYGGGTKEWREAEPETVGDDKAFDEVSCSKHSKYQVKRRPTSDCFDCWKMWANKLETELSHERSTVREAIEIGSELIAAAEQCGVEGPYWSNACYRYGSFLAAHKPEKETGGEFCDD